MSSLECPSAVPLPLATALRAIAGCFCQLTARLRLAVARCERRDPPQPGTPATQPPCRQSGATGSCCFPQYDFHTKLDKRCSLIERCTPVPATKRRGGHCQAAESTALNGAIAHTCGRQESCVAHPKLCAHPCESLFATQQSKSLGVLRIPASVRSQPDHTGRELAFVRLWFVLQGPDSKMSRFKYCVHPMTHVREIFMREPCVAPWAHQICRTASDGCLSLSLKLAAACTCLQFILAPLPCTSVISRIVHQPSVREGHTAEPVKVLDHGQGWGGRRALDRAGANFRVPTKKQIVSS